MIHLKPKVQIPAVVRLLYRKAFWRFKHKYPTVYLTFDDGPVPEVTPWVLDILNAEKIKATFFCVGENVKKYPEVYQQILDLGHSVGNHTFNHVQGLKSMNGAYYKNVEKAAIYINSNLFRPPHGFLRWKQYLQVKKQYRIIMWDVLSRDFDAQLSKEEINNNIMDFVRPGSIITFHDSIKAEENLRKSLQGIIKKLKNNGYSFAAIPYKQIN